MKITKKFIALALSLGLVLGMGTTAFADTEQPKLTNLLPYPNTQEFNKLVNYAPNFARTVDLQVQGADQYYSPFAMTQTEASGVTFTPYDNLSVKSKSVSKAGAGFSANAKITIPAGQKYGPKFVKATLPGYKPGSWTGMIDLGVILNSGKHISAKNVNVYYFDGVPASNNRLKKVTNLNVTQGLVKSPIKYASAIDAAKAGNDNITLKNKWTINVYAHSMNINGKEYAASGNIGWQYKVYDDSGTIIPNCDKAGAEVFPVESGRHVVWAYGVFGILPDHIDTNLFN